VLSDDCVLGYPPARMIAASGVSTLYWMLRMGPALHAEITMMGRNIKAHEALDRNLVNRVVPKAELDSTIDAVVDAVLAIPTDGLAISKFNKRVAYDILGVRASKLQSAMGHAMQVQQRMEPGDWNLMRERNAGGARGAISSRDERFRDALLRFNPDSANL
jgi:enoyl-CoA hydratase